MKRWTQIFRALANINRLKIIKLLSGSGPLSVTEIASEINISLKGTSKHLLLLSSLDVLDSIGKQGHVFYDLDKNTPKDIRQALSLFV